MNEAVTRIGKTALKIYANHMISFTIGAILGAFTAFTVLTPYIVAASQ